MYNIEYNSDYSVRISLYILIKFIENECVLKELTEGLFFFLFYQVLFLSLNILHML